MNFYRLRSEKESIEVFDKPSCFNLNKGCQNCGTNAERHHLIVNKIPKTNIDSTIQLDYLISKEILNDLKSQNIIVSYLKEVKLNKDKSNTGFFHLTGEKVLPKMLKSSEGMITSDQCNICLRNGHYDTIHENPQYHYSMIEDFNNTDIFSTWEQFGPSILKPLGNRVFRISRPRIVISEKVKNVLEQIKYGKLHFEQIRII